MSFFSDILKASVDFLSCKTSAESFQQLYFVSKPCKKITVLQTEEAEIWFHNGALEKEHKDGM